MDVTCTKGHAQTITDPTEASWEYTTLDGRRVETVTYADGTTGEIERVITVPTARRIVWKCAAHAPTDDNPAALCGSVQEINEVL